MTIKQRLARIAVEGSSSNPVLYGFVLYKWGSVAEQKKRELIKKPTSRASDLLHLFSEKELEAAYARWLIEKGD